jgi:putative ABC transport system ATP-binding protein
MSDNENGILYDLRKVTRTYGTGHTRVDALMDVDLEIRGGEYVAIVGASGSGKSTLLQLLGALDRPTSGSISFLEQSMNDMSENGLTRLRRESIGFIFQQFNLIPTLTAEQNVEAALAGAGARSRDAMSRARLLLSSVGLESRGRHLPGKMSGGEQQRVAIARALANNPRVLLADEPTGNLDSDTGREVITTLRSLAEEQGQTVVIVTHDPRIAAGAPRLIHMTDGTLSDGGDETLRYLAREDAAAN